MTFGLNSADYKLLENLVITPLKQKSVRVFVFGSRATGRNHPFSDIDLLLEPLPTRPIELSELSQIKESIEEARFPIKVDLVLFDDLAQSYKNRVLQEKIEI